MNDKDIEKLRHRLLDEIYAMAFTGTLAAFLDENKIKLASAEELLKIAERFGIN